MFHNEHEPKPLRKVEVRYLWQIVMFVQCGFRLRTCRRGSRLFMVRQ